MKQASFYILCGNYNKPGKEHVEYVHGFIEGEIGYHNVGLDLESWTSTDLDSGLAISSADSLDEAVMIVDDLRERLQETRMSKSYLSHKRKFEKLIQQQTRGVCDGKY